TGFDCSGLVYYAYKDLVKIHIPRTACDPKQAVAVANKIVNDGIQYVIGHLCSSSTQPASDIYEDEGILMISPAQAATGLPAAALAMYLAAPKARR
ncbi:NlpC/P60 family protein, partial [Klebsiella pneumoniae]|uniref:NlpC/P60 family protein n=1 Tax=Klebsiella pneumoniae TaxID=573 RepID=UPI00210CB57B